MIKLLSLLYQTLEEEKAKRDRCLRIADRKFDKPSAYKSGAVVRCRKGDIWKDLKEDKELEKLGINFYNYVPYSFSPDLNSLNKEEHATMMNDLRKERIGLIDYLKFANSMSNEPIYKNIFSKLIRSNTDKISFTLDQNKIFDYEGPLKLQKFKIFYEKYKDLFPNWALENKKLYEDVTNALKLSLNEKQKESLHKWFKRQGTPGKESGWVDCNAPIRKDGKVVGYKTCGRKEGEKRAKYPSCRPTASQCKTPGKGTKWGKTK